MSDSMGRSLLRTAVFALLYVLTTYAGRLTVMDATNLSLVWPAAGVLAVWFVTQWRSPWRWMDLTYLVTITLVVNTTTGASLALASLFAGANLSQAMLFAWLFHRWLPGLRLLGGSPIAKLTELWRFIAAAVLSTAVGAALGPTGIWLLTGHYSWESTAVWLARNSVSILLIGIAMQRIVSVVGTFRGRHASGDHVRPTNLRLLEYLAVTGLSAAAYYLAFGLGNGLPVAFALIAMTVWAAVRLRTTFVILHDLVFGTIAILFTLHGDGPFAQIASHPLRALVAQLFVGTVAVVGLTLAFGRDERNVLLAQLRKSERAANEQARTMTTIVDAMTEGLGVVDENGRFLLRNPAAGQLLGVRSATGHIAGNSYYGLFRPDGTPLAETEAIHQQIFDGNYEARDLLIRNAAVPDGRIINVTGRELPPGDDGLRKALIVFHDVTADRRHRDELTSFAGVVAHDLLNPLTTVEGWSEALAGELDENDRFATDTVTRIQRAAARMRSLINGLLAYTTARDGGLSASAVDLDEVVRDIATGRLDHAESTAASMPRFDIGDLPWVDADAVLSRQLLENLIGNAIKYTAPGVVPQISVRGEKIGNGFVRITLDDNGIGIPPGQYEAIFQNFHRAHPGAEYAGTGLGLAICKRIVERHGGTIVAAGNEHGGSRMSFTLPARRRESPAALGATGDHLAPSSVRR
ncbi:ATP-binding protein [Micromonosporaceae bacterium Da 78-11]